MEFRALRIRIDKTEYADSTALCKAYRLGGETMTACELKVLREIGKRSLLSASLLLVLGACCGTAMAVDVGQSDAAKKVQPDSAKKGAVDLKTITVSAGYVPRPSRRDPSPNRR